MAIKRKSLFYDHINDLNIMNYKIKIHKLDNVTLFQKVYALSPSCALCAFFEKNKINYKTILSLTINFKIIGKCR